MPPLHFARREMAYFPARRLTVIARDPSVRMGGAMVRATVEIPNEDLQPGPRGWRVLVVDYDASSRILYRTVTAPPNRADGPPDDPFARACDDELLASPGFHAFNCYAIVMHTLARFEFALGRRVAWRFPGHQIKVAPHAFRDANAFYSPADEALLIGCVRPEGRPPVFGCLSHDIVAHETAHALLDGLRQCYTDPSSPDQAGFHEGFADLVALLSVFALREVVARVLDPAADDLVRAEAVTAAALRQSILLALAPEFGEELSGIRGNPLRRSVTLAPEDVVPDDPEPHRRGEVLVAAVMDALLNVWVRRLRPYIRDGVLDRNRAEEEGAAAAARTLTMCIRALDYCPPTGLQFADFAGAVLTADQELYPRDEKYLFRAELQASFARYGIPCRPWDPPQEEPACDRTHFEQMQHDPDEVFRFLWENRRPLGLHENAYTKVLSVRPCVRTGADGFVLRETVAEFLQLVRLRAAELRTLGLRAPDGMSAGQEVTLYGGNTMVFDQFGRLKYNIGNSLFNAARQQARLDYLWESGFFERTAAANPFAAMHRRRGMEFR